VSLRRVLERDRQPAESSPGRDEESLDLGKTSAYLVEIVTPERGVEGVSTRARRIAGAARFLRSIYVPEDDRWFLLYQASCLTDVADVVERAQLDVVSIAVSRAPEAMEATIAGRRV
jgi:hypothetical protein